MQLKYSNYAAFSHFDGIAVNNSGLFIPKRASPSENPFTASNFTLAFFYREHFATGIQNPAYSSVQSMKVQVLQTKPE